MPVRTVALDALILAREAAGTGLPDLWVILLLFPAVAVAAPILIRTAVMIFANEIFRRPILTRHRLIPILLWLAAEVLPVVRVDAQFFVMLKGKWAPGGLKIEHVKVSVLRHLVQDVYSKLAFVMCEGAIHVSVLADFEVVWV